MNRPAAVLEESYRACRAIARRAHSSFYPCFLLLPREKRRAMYALYAFMRHTDDLVDNAGPVETRRRALMRWRGALAETLAGEMPRGDEQEPGGSLLPALADAVREYSIPHEHLVAVIDGVEMDLEHTSYETFADLAEYCHRVASAVGLASLYVWGFQGAEPRDPARSCGLAFQLTNILRDLAADARVGRVYVPQEDLRRWCYDRKELATGVADERFTGLIEFQVARARRFYEEATALLEQLGPDGRRIYGMMWSVYRRLLEEIAAQPSALFRRRVHVARWRKALIAGRWALWPTTRLRHR